MSGVWFSVLVVLEFLVHDCGRTFGASSGNQSPTLPHYEVDAINKLLTSTKQPWDNEYKDFSASDCGRRGVVCICDDNSNTCHITEILFDNHGLSGQMPEEIGNLSSLQSLDLHGNKLNGQIPNSFSKLLNLTELILAGNLLEGPIPQFIAKLTSLTILFYSKKWLEEGEGRVPPNEDPEVASERNKCFKRIFQSEDCKAAIADYALFAMSAGPFNDTDSIAAMEYMEPRSWWTVYGSSAPLLQKLALKVLGQPSSSSCAERNWSIYSFIHSLRRNKLTPSRAEHLVFVHNNLRLLSRSNPEYQSEKTKMWDVGGDDFGSMEDVGFLEIANLTLDEPELENAFCEEAGDNIEE